MALEFMDKIAPFLPGIKDPKSPLSLRQKIYWTAGVIALFFLLYNTYAIGVDQARINQLGLQLISIIFASRIGSIITIGIGPIVLASIVLQLFSGSGLLNIDQNNPIEKARFQSLQKLFAIVIALIESFIYIASGYVPILSSGLTIGSLTIGASFMLPLVVLQLFFGSFVILMLDETMTKYGVTSGINLFIAAGVSYSIVASTATIIVPAAVGAIAAGGAAAISNAILAFGPLLCSAGIFIASIYAYEVKVELPLAFGQVRGVGGRFPIPLLYVSVIPVVLALSLESSITIWTRFLAGVTGSFASIAQFFAYYVPSTSGPVLSGGVFYLISSSFPLPYAAPYGIGGYGAYFSHLATYTTTLILPWGGLVMVPEWIHVIVFTVVLVALSVIFGKFWIGMAGQGPKDIAEQIGDYGFQIPGFRRDPRIVESILNKYIPTITVLGSMFVGLLAALATLTGAVGTGTGILLTVGIIYMLYQQLQQERLFETYPILNKIVGNK